MTDQDRPIEELLASAEMTVEPDPARMRVVQDRVLAIVRGSWVGRRVRRAAGFGVLLLAGAATAGFAGTQAGRNLFRRIVTPVWTSQVVMYSPEPEQSDAGANSSDDAKPVSAIFVGSNGGDVPPFTPEQTAAMQAEMAETMRLQQSGGGRLTGLMEDVGLDREDVGPDGDHPHTGFTVEYTLSNGKTVSVGTSLTPQQRKNMRIDEILKLRDSGAGQVVSSKPFDMGLGRYTIRFTLADGTSIDLETRYPPGTREERAQIFAETRKLKAARQFTVEDASSDGHSGVWGILRYTLADGRKVGISEPVPSDVLSVDGKQVITFETESAPATTRSAPAQ